jgi:hypothetical protein
MHAKVITRIHVLARRNINGLDFGDRFGNPILAPDDVADYANDDDNETWVPDDILDNNDVANNDYLNNHDYDECMFDNDINPPYDENNNVPGNHDPEMEPENEVEPEIEPEDEPEPEPDRENENKHEDEVDNENELEQLDDDINNLNNK